jgi:pimeloyl-ACP methyl ester carboxylesterase
MGMSNFTFKDYRHQNTWKEVNRFFPENNRIGEGCLKWVANTGAIVNDKKMLKILLKDRTSSGVRVPVRFLHSVIFAQPAIEPDHFDYCPVALYHPEKDKWTPVEISKIFFDRIKGVKELKILENAGHFPLEIPGIVQLEKYTEDFLNKYLSQINDQL